MIFVLQTARDFFERSSMGSIPQVLVNGIAVKEDELSDLELQDSIVHLIMHLTPTFQKAVYHVSSHSCFQRFSDAE